MMYYTGEGMDWKVVLFAFASVFDYRTYDFSVRSLCSGAVLKGGTQTPLILLHPFHSWS